MILAGELLAKDQDMKYFIVFAHPEPASLNGWLRDRAAAALVEAGHEVEVSDLYAMKWKAEVDGGDFPDWESDRLDVAAASEQAYRSGRQPSDVAEEQRKLLWADFVVFQFPLWWFGMPAILKGWVDRVFARGFAYGVGSHTGRRWGDRFGEGTLAGRRAMAVVTVGGRASHYGPLGVCGSIDDILWPVHHGVFFYPGMTVMPPAVFYQAGRATEEAAEEMAAACIQKLLAMGSDEPIPFRAQNGGDYDGHQVLNAGLAGDASGLLAHQKAPAYRSNILLEGPPDFGPRHFAPDSRSEGQAKA